MTPAQGSFAPGLSSKLNLGIDLVWLLASVMIAAMWSGRTDGTVHAELVWFGVAASAVWLITATALRHYDPGAEREVMDDIALVSILVLAVTTVLTVVTLVGPESTSLPRVPQFLMTVWPVALVLRVGIFRHLAASEGPLDDVLIIGTGPMGRITCEDIQRKGRRHVAGFLRFDDEQRPDALKASFLGTVGELEGILRTVPVSEVYIAGSTLKHAEAMQAAIKVCEKFGLPFALPAYSFRLDRARPVASRAIADGYIHYVSIDVKPSQMAIKRLFDIVASAVALWLLFPLLAGVAIIIKLTSRGPIFFKQVRTGLHGKPFNMLKFRSMVVNAEELKAKLEKLNEQSGPVFKMKNDPRVTRIGRFIRKFSIDELPQLINVLRGDMSVVGPRPPVPPEVAKYEAWQRRRLSVRPGLTCIWQVSGRNQISFEQWMYLDMQYIDHWSLKGDINLILKTVPVVLTGRGAS
ncbi:MAG: sugar transferase [Myxococcaceae bacterium]|nr:sugar transferase [Myxococcaceae bacterium]